MVEKTYDEDDDSCGRHGNHAAEPQHTAED
jgi:hypothetical protein